MAHKWASRFYEFRRNAKLLSLVGKYVASKLVLTGYSTADLMAEYVFNPDVLLRANLTNIANKLYGESLYRGHYIPGAGRQLQVPLVATL